MDCTDNGDYHCHKRQRGRVAALHKRKLPQISGADAWHSRSKLLLRMESIYELRPQKYSSKTGDVSYRISRSL